MSLHLDERADGGFALYIDGDLQFDTADEAIYHESLALPALCLARPASEAGLRVLICGGGDGLALRECLRFPNVAHADLVDYAPEIVELGRTRFADLNLFAFDDPRVQVHYADAWEFLENAPPYDVILCDFTVPRRPDDTRIFTQEWYSRVGKSLASNGVAALNAVSPQRTPEAFWCLRNTVRSAGLSTLPYHVCIPSFRAHDYGAWGFLLAAHRSLHQSDLRAIGCPVPTRQTDLTKLWRGACFHREARRSAARIPIHTLADPVLLRLLLNPEAAPLPPDLLPPGATGLLRLPGASTDAPSAPHERRESREKEENTCIGPFPSGRGLGVGRGEGQTPEPYNLDPLLRSIPIAHPYHTRQMVETLAEQVVGSVKTLDLRRLVDALLKRAALLPGDVCNELLRLRDFLRDRLPRIEVFQQWSYRLFATLVILLTLANAVAPDNAFAKGSFGLGHASMSRGYSGSYRSSGSSFGGQRGFGGSFGNGRASVSGSFGRPSARITSSGFRATSYARGRPVDIYGTSYSERVFIYCGSGPGHYHPYYHVGGGARPANMPPPTTQKAFFVADDDMLVMENGDVVITLSDNAYLLVSNGTVALFNNKLPDPLLAMYADPNLFKNIQAELEDQQRTIAVEIQDRKDWLAWVGWSSSLFPTIEDDKMEVRNLEDLNRRIETAKTRIGKPPVEAPPATVDTGSVELFSGCFLLPDKRIAMRRSDGLWQYTDGKQMWSNKPGEAGQTCPPELLEGLRGIMQKLQKEFEADLRSDENDMRELQSDRASLQKDLAEYQSLSNSYGPSYEVDYGTDEIAVSDAISRTNTDLQQNQSDYDQTLADYTKTTRDLTTLRTVNF